jgi:serine/threonine protein kinase
MCPKVTRQENLQIRQAIKKLKLSTSKIVEGARSIFRNLNINSDRLRQITNSNTFITFYADSQQPVLLDCTNYPPDTPMDRVRPDARDLARLLQNVDPMTFGLLKCNGAIEWRSEEDKPVSQFQFIFDIPTGLPSMPTTLRQILVEQNQFPLNQRVQLARQLARSVIFVHSTGFVHKSIRPDTIIVFAEQSGNGNPTVGQSFLTGFERFRRDGGLSDLVEDLDWAKNLYRHPQRQGTLWPEDLFKMQHDVYSLGMCLLEIGLWSSFVRADGDDTVP